MTQYVHVGMKGNTHLMHKGLIVTTHSVVPALPCLFRNNCINTDALKLKAKYRKPATALAWNIERLADLHGLENLGFLTLTFADHVTCPKESQRRFHSLKTNVISKRYLEHIRVFERQKSGRIHYHLVVVLKDDIRTGFDWDEFKKGRYSSANAPLRAEWAFWRTTAPKYKFGRTELLPVRSNAEGISRYVGKYLGKHFEAREVDDKGVRLVEYSRGARMATTKMSFVTEGSKLWRVKVAMFAAELGHVKGLNRPATMEEISEFLGPKWAYFNRAAIFQYDLHPKQHARYVLKTFSREAHG